MFEIREQNNKIVLRTPFECILAVKIFLTYWLDGLLSEKFLHSLLISFDKRNGCGFLLDFSIVKCTIVGLCSRVEYNRSWSNGSKARNPLLSWCISLFVNYTLHLGMLNREFWGKFDNRQKVALRAFYVVNQRAAQSENSTQNELIRH